MEDYGFSVSRWQNTDSILSTINCLQTLYLFRFNIDIPVAAIDDCGLQAAIKHGRSRMRKVCLILMLTKICGDKTFRDRDPSWFFFSPGWHVTSVFQGLSLSRSMGAGRREPWERVGFGARWFCLREVFWDQFYNLTFLLFSPSSVMILLAFLSCFLVFFFVQDKTASFQLKQIIVFLN